MMERDGHAGGPMSDGNLTDKENEAPDTPTDQNMSAGDGGYGSETEIAAEEDDGVVGSE